MDPLPEEEGRFRYVLEAIGYYLVYYKKTDEFLGIVICSGSSWTYAGSDQPFCSRLEASSHLYWLRRKEQSA